MIHLLQCQEAKSFKVEQCMEYVRIYSIEIRVRLASTP